MSQTRCITLLGPGGSGKTRLAAHVARALADHEIGRDGVVWLELAALENPAQIPLALLSACGLDDHAGHDPLEAVLHFMQRCQMLLVLDNCEHLISACAATVYTLLAHCPNLRILTTSRERLNIAAESVYLVDPLPLPPESSSLSPADLDQYDAIRLFAERAQALRPDFVLTNDNAIAVAKICRTLDGLPLALELAAAQITILGMAQIASQLDDALHLLKSRFRDLPARHQTMQAVIDWSYDLLSHSEQRLWNQLAVFAAGFSLDAVARICNENALELLTALERKSMVVVVHNGDATRYRMLEPMRQYALERLRAAGQEVAVRSRHCDYYLDWGMRHESRLRGTGQVAWRQRYEAEYPNLQLALNWSIRSEERAGKALRLAAPLGSYWLVSNKLAEGRAWLEETIAHAGDRRMTIPGAQVLCLAAIFALLQSDYRAARPLAKRSLEASQALEWDGQWGIGYALAAQGMARRLHGGEGTALRYLRRSVELFRETGDDFGLALSLIGVSSVARLAGNDGEARAAEHESGLVWRTMGDPWGMAFYIHDTFTRAIADGDATLARALYEENVEQFEALGYWRPLAYMRHALGHLASENGNHDVAKGHFQSSLSLARQTGNLTIEALSLAGLGNLAWRQGNIEEAVASAQQALVQLEALQRWRLASGVLQEFAAIAEQDGNVTGSNQLRDLAATLEEVNGAPGSSARQGALAIAGALVELRKLSLIHDKVEKQVERETASYMRLTPREHDVLLLVAEGLTDPTIAERLVISPRTVHAHLRSIYRKLDVNTRTAAARVASEEGLL
ncbi:MAG: LuxR C-terminal-related transcriptional regulator [Candidatus Promineifilaceae bacterium]|nr:LuxR C-terminal-related transcriptional regulator [Candidatus Promineifilaceae bacterium]